MTRKEKWMPKANSYTYEFLVIVSFLRLIPFDQSNDNSGPIPLFPVLCK